MVFIMPAARRFLVSDIQEGCGLNDRVQYVDGLLNPFVNTGFCKGWPIEWMETMKEDRKMTYPH